MAVKVSVIMPVYNGVDYLELSIRSILSQTFTNFELIILDDASTDESWKIMLRFADEDHRIRLLRNSSNRGLISSLNSLLDATQGELIARQDHDDLSDEERFSKQVLFMDANPEIGLLGTAFHQIDMQGNILLTTYQPSSDTEIRWKILFANPFAHTSVMFRRKLLTKNNLRYSNDFPHSEDYELWIRMLQHTKAANLTDPLVSWRRNVKGISQTHIDEQNRNWKTLSAMQLNRLLSKSVSEEEAALYFCLYTHQPLRKEELARLVKLPQILRSFSMQKGVDLDAEGLRKNRYTMVHGLLESLFNGLSLYGYYGNPGVYRLLACLFWLYPTGVTFYVFGKLINFIKKSL